MRETLVKSEEFKDSPVGRIPKDWETPTFEEITVESAPICYGIVQPGSYVESGVPVVAIQNLNSDYQTNIHRSVQAIESRYIRSRIHHNDVLLSVKGTIGRVDIVPSWFSGNISRDVARIRLKPCTSPRYIRQMLLAPSSQKRLEQAVVGTTRAEISIGILKQLRLPLPPLPEQEHIAEILDTMDEAIAHTSSLIAKLKQMKAGLLHDLLTRGLDENGELRNAIAHPEQFKDSPLGRIPKAWEVRLVGEVFDLQLGKMLSKASKIGHSPFPYLANRNVQWDEVDLSDLEWMDFNDNEREKFSLLPGDLLVCEGGESGRTAIWKGEMENCYFQKAIHRLRPKDSQVLPNYMLRFMRRAFEHGFLTSFTSQTSITHLTREKFALLPLPLPTVEEQKAIVNVLDSHDARIRKEEAYREKLKLQKQGLMHDLLIGKVRVNDMYRPTSVDNTVQLTV